jgi:DNA-binding transcriptional LysR family regulator
MDKPAQISDWTLVQSFLAVAETGSLSGAARVLSLSQPTVGRHISALEQHLGDALFTRHARGLHLTAFGAALNPDAMDMRAAMQRISLTVAGKAKTLQGTVRITASVFASHHMLPPILANIRAREPAISIELVATDSAENLLFHEADIAVRMYRSEQLDIVIKQVGDVELGSFAATRYLDRVGRPKSLDDVLKLDLVGYDRNELIIQTMRSMGWQVDRDSFATRCDNQAVNWELVRAGCGIGFAQAHVGRSDPLVEEVAFDVDIPRLPIWLAAHNSMRRTPRVKRVWDLLSAGLSSRRY